MLNPLASPKEGGFWLIGSAGRLLFFVCWRGWGWVCGWMGADLLFKRWLIRVCVG